MASNLKNIEFCYFYRDAFGGKVFHSVVFSNQEKFFLKQIRAIIHKKFIQGKYFYPESVGLPVFFAPMAELCDHPPYHEYSHVSKTSAPVTSKGFVDIVVFLEQFL